MTKKNGPAGQDGAKGAEGTHGMGYKAWENEASEN